MVLKVCRLCLVTDVRTFAISGGPLQHIYEKLTNVPLHRGNRPVVACYLCHYRLMKTHDLMVQSVEADNILTEICQNASVITRELITGIDREAYKLNDVRGRSTVVQLAMDPKFTAEELKIKEKLSSDDDSKHVENMAWESQDEGRDVDTDLDERKLSEILQTVKSDESDELNIKEEPLSDFEETEVMLFKGSDDIVTEYTEELNIKEEPLSDYEETEVMVFKGSDDIVTECSEGAVLVKKLNQIDDMLLTPRESMMKQNNNIIEEEAQSRNYIVENTQMKLEAVSTKKTTKLKKPHESINSIVENTEMKLKAVSTKKTKKLKKPHESITLTVEEHILYNCTICQCEYVRKFDLMRHLETHTKEELFKCKSDCDFSEIGNLKNLSNKKKSRYECMLCSRGFRKRKCLNKHLKTHTEEEPFKYDDFIEKANFNDFLKPSLEEKLYQCEICQRRFLNKLGLNNHLKTHNGKKPFKCEICYRRFNQRTSLHNHLKTHNGEKPFKCEICHRGYIQKANLNNHIKTHTGEKPFKCNICHRGFIQKPNLDNHIKTHTGEKPFKCHICQRGFIQKPNLDNHLKTHTGEKPFKCAICKRGYIQKVHLKNHLKTHTGETYSNHKNLLKSEVCQEKITKKLQLNKRLRIHNRENPLKITFSYKNHID